MSLKFKFIAERNNSSHYEDFVDSKLTYETQAETLSDVLEDFACFLKGVGFYIDGDLVVDSEEK